MKLKVFALSLFTLSVLSTLAPESRAEIPLGQIHVNSYAYQVWNYQINSCARSGLHLRSIRLRTDGKLKANAATVFFGDGGSESAIFNKDAFKGEVVAEIWFQWPRCVAGLSLNARGDSIVHISGDEAGAGHHYPAPRPPHPGHPHRPGWDLPPPPAPAPVPAPELHALEVVFSSQDRCRDLRQSVLVRRNEAEQAQLCTAAAAQTGARIMRTALVKFNDGSSRCDNFADGDLASVCLAFMRTVR